MNEGLTTYEETPVEERPTYRQFYSYYQQNTTKQEKDIVKTSMAEVRNDKRNKRSDMYSFNRGKLADLVSLLSGRDFETREFREDIVEGSYQKLSVGIQKFINEYNFNQFVLAIRGAGYKSSKMLNSQMTLDFAYMLFLKLMDDESVLQAQEKRYVQKWFVLSTLTGRYVGSPESVMSRDIRSINEKGFLPYFNEIEASVLPDTFWSVTLPQNLETTSVNSPAFNTFLAAQD